MKSPAKGLKKLRSELDKLDSREESILDTELLTILADYSNDLHALKKRDGQLPAQAAVKRIKRLFRV